MRTGLMMVLVVVGCGGRQAPTQIHRNADPPFERDIPAGFIAQPVQDDPPDGALTPRMASISSGELAMATAPSS